MELQRQQCELHPERGAVARCPVCARFYCHECITEHEGAVLCRRCLNQESQTDEDLPGFIQRHRGLLKLCAIPFVVAVGYLLLVFVFAALGLMLIRFPDDFHHAVPEAFSQTRGGVK